MNGDYQAKGADLYGQTKCAQEAAPATQGAVPGDVVCGHVPNGEVKDPMPYTSQPISKQVASLETENIKLRQLVSHYSLEAGRTYKQREETLYEFRSLANRFEQEHKRVQKLEEMLTDLRTRVPFFTPELKEDYEKRGQVIEEMGRTINAQARNLEKFRHLMYQMRGL